MNRQLKKKVMDFISTRDRFGATEAQKELKVEKKMLLPILQELLRSKRLVLYNSNDGIIFEVRSEKEAKKYQNLSKDQKLVLQEIKKAGSKGIWIRNIKSRTNLPTVTINSVLKTLERRDLIKSIKSITAKKQKLYMAFDVIPDVEHTGGVWYDSNGEFDEEFVNRIAKWTLAMITQHGKQSAVDLAKNMRKSKLSNVPLVEKDFVRIIDKLRFENEVEKFVDPETANVYYEKNTSATTQEWKLVSKISSEEYLSETMCGVCPVNNQCSVGGIISPKTCIYLDSWLGSTNLRF